MHENNSKMPNNRLLKVWKVCTQKRLWKLWIRNMQCKTQIRCFSFRLMFWLCLIDKFQTTTHSMVHTQRNILYERICFDGNKLLCKMFYIYSHGFNEKPMQFSFSIRLIVLKKRHCSAMLMSYIKLSHRKAAKQLMCVRFFWCSQFFHIHLFLPLVCRMHFSDSFVHVKLDIYAYQSTKVMHIFSSHLLKMVDV